MMVNKDEVGTKSMVEHTDKKEKDPKAKQAETWTVIFYQVLKHMVMRGLAVYVLHFVLVRFVKGLRGWAEEYQVGENEGKCALDQK